MRRLLLLFFCGVMFEETVLAQSAVDRPEEVQKRKAKKAVAKEQEQVAHHAANIELRGAKVFSEKELRSQLKEQITTIEQYGLSPARADDTAFFLEVFYRKQGYAKVDVHYTIESGERLVLDIFEGPLVTLGLINFIGNDREPPDKLFEYVVGPTRERYSKLQKTLPFVETDIKEGADLVHRFYVSQGFLDSMLDPPHYVYVGDGTHVNVTIAIHEGRQYFFGHVTFRGQTIYGEQALLGQLLDLLNKPYTDARLADIPRRLQAYFKARGYYDVKVDAVGDPVIAREGHVPVEISLEPGPLYHFDGTTVTGLTRLHPSYVTKRFQKLNGKTYSPDALDERFRELMRTGLFNLVQIKPTPVGGNLLRLDISAEEAKSKEFGLSIGYGSYVGGIFGIQYRDLDLFGYGRPLTTSFEITSRSYKGEIAYEDPYLFDSEFQLKTRLYALTFDFDGYSKFELGGRFDLARQFTKRYKAGLIFWARHVEITTNDIRPPELAGPTNYFVSSLGFTQTLDLRDSPVVPTRGLIFDNTFDLATSGLGSDIDFIRSTFRVSYYVSFAKAAPTASDIGTELGDKGKTSWFERSGLAFGARMGIIHPLNSDTTGSVRHPDRRKIFQRRKHDRAQLRRAHLGPHDKRGHPIGGEFYTDLQYGIHFPALRRIAGRCIHRCGNLLPTPRTTRFR